MPVDDPRLNDLLDDFVRDKREGITLRSVRNELKGLRRNFDDHQREMRDRVKALETRNEVEDRQDANGTGPHPVIAVGTPVQAIPSPFRGPQWPPQPPAPTWADVTPPVQPIPDRSSQHAIVIETSEKKSGFFGSFWKGLKKYLGHSLAALVAALFTLGVTWASNHGCGAAQQVQHLETPAAASSR